MSHSQFRRIEAYTETLSENILGKCLKHSTSQSKRSFLDSMRPHSPMFHKKGGHGQSPQNTMKHHQARNNAGTAKAVGNRVAPCKCMQIDNKVKETRWARAKPNCEAPPKQETRHSQGRRRPRHANACKLTTKSK